jgi:hypothetical protein
MYPALTRAICALLVLLLSGLSEPLFAQSSSTPATTQNPVQPPIELPDSPGRSASQPQAQPSSSQGIPQNTSQTTPPANQPSGTATAPSVQVSGGAASKPAGVAIAPPKQRQVRSLLIKLGFLAGAGVALGTVAALSAGSPGHVPNSPGH